MKNSQLYRLNRIDYEKFYILNQKKEENKLIFDISGSTSNIYKVKLYLLSKTIFCNCPDAKTGAKYNNVICKHCCFILVKVFKLTDLENYFETYKLSDEHIFHIIKEFDNINLTVNNEFINLNYINKYKEIQNTEKPIDNSIKLRENHDNICTICYGDFDNITDLKENKQCKVCLIIIHNECLNKWLNMGNNTCPYCRSIIKSDQQSHYKNLFL